MTRRLRRPDALTVHAAACLLVCAGYAAGLVATDPHRDPTIRFLNHVVITEKP